MKGTFSYIFQSPVKLTSEQFGSSVAATFLSKSWLSKRGQVFTKQISGFYFFSPENPHGPSARFALFVTNGHLDCKD